LDRHLSGQICKRSCCYYGIRTYSVKIEGVRYQLKKRLDNLSESAQLVDCDSPCADRVVVTNNMFLLFFFNMRLPYAFHLTYLNTSLLAGIHKLSNICLTCVCFMVNTPLPHICHMFNMLFTHVCSTFHYYLNQ
jgi:hypothetical protein